MALFGKKRASSPVRDGPPTEKVLQFRREGLSNNQIVQSLQRSGYRTEQIFDAMNQADLRGAGPQEDAVPPDLAEQPSPPYPEDTASPDDTSSDDALLNSDADASPFSPAVSALPSPAPDASSDERMEEIAEAIIEEKWNELVKDVSKVVEWKQTIETKIQRLDQNIDDVRKDVQSLHKALFERMDTYDQNVAKVGTNVKAMEEVFRKTLPSLTESVSDLSRITGTLKKQKKAK